MGTKISFSRFDGKEAAGYLAKPGRAKGPGIVVIQEWWGLQEQIKGICDRFARAGYEALAPDLFAGTVVGYHDPDAANLAMTSLDFLDATDQTVRGAVQYLAKSGARVGLTGFCMGGAITVLGACRISELSAAVAFYGIPPAQAAKPADVRIPLQGHFSNTDNFFTPESVDVFEAGLRAGDKTYAFYRYDAGHAFMNEQRPTVHDRVAAELAWDRTLAFLNKHIG
jgi:carboxymethylenebutenolidase